MKKTLATHLMVSLHCFFQFQNRTFCRFPEWHLLMDVKLREFFNSFNVICHIALIVNSNLTSLEFNVFFNKHFCFILCSFPPWFISQKSTFLSPFFFKCHRCLLINGRFFQFLISKAKFGDDP